MYDVTPYYLSKMLFEMPLLVVLPFMMQVIVYWAIGFNPAAKSFFM